MRILHCYYISQTARRRHADINFYRLHFIPVSSSYKEVYNIHAYFSGPSTSALEAIGSEQANVPLDERRPLEGDRRLRRIARAGKEWKQTIGRTVDMEGQYSV